MAILVTTDILRELAAFRSEQGCALSLYIDLDASGVPTIPTPGRISGRSTTWAPARSVTSTGSER